MAKILISAVGNRDPFDEKSNEQGPILTTLNHLRPDVVLLVYNLPPATRPMEENALKTKKVLEQWGFNVEMYPLELPDPANYDFVIEAFRKMVANIKAKYREDELLVGVSSGTPQMQTAWLLLISQGSLPAQAYYTLDPKYKDKDQPPVRSISIAFLHEDALLKTARNHFQSFHFHSAAQALTAFADSCSLPSRRHRASLLKRYCNALGFWDDFKLREAKHELQSVTKHIPIIEPQYKTICHLVDDQVKSKTEETLLILTDLLYNASRSLARGQFADTLARVIRTYEGFLKWRLRHKYNTPANMNDMQPETSKKIKEFLDRNCRLMDKKGYLMSDTIELLLQEFYEDEDVKRWKKNMVRFRYARNKSIVAHGTDEVKEKTAKEALQFLREILSANGADLDRYPLSDENLRANEESIFSSYLLDVTD